MSVCESDDSPSQQLLCLCACCCLLCGAEKELATTPLGRCKGLSRLWRFFLTGKEGEQR